MSNVGVLFEIIWFVMGGLLLFIGIDQTLDQGIGSSWHYLLFALLALLMYYRRRRMRISEKKNG
jgi:hypothetical protein